jgi:hypothetical protein
MYPAEQHIVWQEGFSKILVLKDGTNVYGLIAVPDTTLSLYNTSSGLHMCFISCVKFTYYVS